MRKRFMPPGRPHVNGLAERMNRVGADFMSKLGANQSKWEESFNERLAVYNRKYCAVIRKAPNTL